MRTQLCFIFVFFIFMSCGKDEAIQQTVISDGIYKGTFQRQIVWAKTDTASITLTIEGNKWSGTSDLVKYPALCSGTYSIDGNTILFVNECIWTTEFDWTLILSGEYNLKIKGNTIEFSNDDRSATKDTYFDVYILKKQE